METEGLARFTQRALWELFAHWGTDQQRIILNPVAAPAPGIRITATDYRVGFRRQGQQFSLLVMGLLEKLQRVTAATSMPDKPKAPARGLSLTELNQVMVPILTAAGKGSIKFPTAKEMAGLVKEEGYKTSVSQVKRKDSLWTIFNRENGGGRGKGGKPKEYTNSKTLRHLVDENGKVHRSTHKTKPMDLSDSDE
jgi:lipoprotein-anchoring transpeptidase ErfK/SrfK